MTKEKYNLYSIDKETKLIDKYDLRITKVFWFLMGFLVAALLIVINFLSYVN
jgi:hypothetical protein